MRRKEVKENPKRFLAMARICTFLFLLSLCTLSDYLRLVLQTSPKGSPCCCWGRRVMPWVPTATAQELQGAPEVVFVHVLVIPLGPSAQGLNLHAG